MRLTMVASVLLLAAGCGDRRRAEFVGTFQTISSISIFKAPEQFHELAFQTREELDKFVQLQVQRLHTASWQLAWLNLRRCGHYAVAALIAGLEDTVEASLTATALPGTVTPGERVFLTRGEVAYAVLREIIGEYSDYAGQMPPYSKAAWETWWAANHRRIRVRTEAVVRAGG